jgi:malonate-semialdehyde dehydrogenase (acetylating)/methylmalonate-semialdehyde dehydrogenase
MEDKMLKIFINGKYEAAESTDSFPVYNPSTGEIQANAPACTLEEVKKAVGAAHLAYPAWRDTPVKKRVQVLFRFRELVLANLDELAETLCRENGKTWKESEGDVLKVAEITEHACGMPSLMMGDSLMNASSGYDTVMYREPLGVFVGIAPFNFPAMIPMGWMMPICVTAGNTMVIKASNQTPMTSLKMAGYLKQAGLPDGVVNVITAGRQESKYLTRAPEAKGITFVGSNAVGRAVYAEAAKHGKRVQALCQAKNHALVLEDAPLSRTARGIINASFGCVGERCMALPVVVAQESIADELVGLIEKFAKQLKVGPGYDKSTGMGPVISPEHKKKVEGWIEKAISEGAKPVLDGRGVKVSGNEGGFYIGPTILDHVTPEMECGKAEVFGPVLFVKRVKDFEEGLAVMNGVDYANGSVIFTQNGYYAREFSRRTDAGMVGINVGIPVPIGVFAFSGHKNSFLGDLHTLGKDGVRFFTESKSVTTRWFDGEEIKNTKIDTWDGTL